MSDTKTKKTRRIITDVDFSSPTSHIALCSAKQGAANNHNKALLLKSAGDNTDLEKAQQVQVTMELPEFLRKFFHLYYDDAEVLAALMGYVTPKVEETDWNPREYIDKTIGNIQLIKSLHEAGDLEKAVGDIKSEDMLELIKTVSDLQGSLEESKIAEVVKSKEKNNMSTKDKVETSIDLEKAAAMQDELVKAKEMLAELQKAADDAKAELELVKQREKDAAVAKTTEMVKSVIGDRSEVAVLVKASELLTEDEFGALTTLIKSYKAMAEGAEVAQEKGITGEAKVTLTKQAQASQDIAAAIKAQFNQQ